VIYAKKLYIPFLIPFSVVILILTFHANVHADYQTNLVYEGYLQDSSGDIDVGSFSVPVIYDWNNDGKKDFLVGQNNAGNGYVSFYDNQGTNISPFFTTSTYIQACFNTCIINVSSAG
jgi:hypothetical protein